MMHPQDELKKDILKVLVYFDYFSYPLTGDQIFKFCPCETSLPEVKIALNDLQELGIIFSLDKFYALRSVEEFVNHRLAGEVRCEMLSNRIKKSAALLSRFPFVKFVGLTGSISKGFASENADIDFFIVTEKNRLWICRSLLHLMKKLSFIKGSQHWYCMNYFVDETAMQIEEQNFFTAIELSTLIPVIDESNCYYLLMSANDFWVKNNLPNATISSNKPKVTNPFFWNKIIQWFSSDFLNKSLMQLTDRKWRSKWKARNYPMADYELAFKTRINISKNHLHNYQKKLLSHLEGLNSKE